MTASVEEDLGGATQKERGKRILRYEKDGERVVAKHIDRREGDSDNIARMAREARILEKLAETGITPKVIDYKEFPDNRAELLLEEIPGTSIDRMPRIERKDFLTRHGEDVVKETARSLQKIRDSGVLVVDVNEGTFLFNEEEDGGLKTGVVDFELGYDIENSSAEELKDSFSFLRKNDFGFALAEREGEPSVESPDLLAKCEMHRWAKMMERMFIQRFPKIEIPPEQSAEYLQYRDRIRPVVEGVQRDRAKSRFANLQKNQRDSDRRYLDMGQEGYIDWSLKMSLDSAVTQESGKYTFPQLCRGNGIPLSEKSMDFIARCLSMDINDRPSSFQEFLADSED